MDAKDWIRNAALLAFALPLTALAALGDSAETAQASPAQMKTAARPDAAGNFTVHTSQAASGTIVKEYAGTDGRVFALSWQGPAQPDLRRFLGRYFEAYRDAAGVVKASHRHLAIRQSDLVVRSAGHMRAFSGMAYVPSLLPSGVNIEDLQ